MGGQQVGANWGQKPPPALAAQHWVPASAQEPTGKATLGGQHGAPLGHPPPPSAALQQTVPFGKQIPAGLLGVGEQVMGKAPPQRWAFLRCFFFLDLPLAELSERPSCPTAPAMALPDRSLTAVRRVALSLTNCAN